MLLVTAWQHCIPSEENDYETPPAENKVTKLGHFWQAEQAYQVVTTSQLGM